MTEYVEYEGIWGKYEGICGNMKEYGKNMKKYVEKFPTFPQALRLRKIPSIFLGSGGLENSELSPSI